MIPVISKADWNRWCVKNSIDLSDAEFVLDTCYLDTKNFNSRPGTLLIAKDSIIHQSYSWNEAPPWSFGESKVRVVVPFEKIKDVKKMMPLSLRVKICQLWPDAHYKFRLYDETELVLNLQRDSDVFEFVLSQHGFVISANVL